MNINQMTRIARMSPHKRYQHCSLIFAGSRLIAYGYNHANMHAEIVAIRRLEAWLRVNNKRPRNLHIVNLMIKKKTGTIGNSMPCLICYSAIYNARIRYITYYDGKQFSQLRYPWI